MNEISEKHNCYIKDYDGFPYVDDVVYFYNCTPGKDRMPKILDVDGNRIVFEYIDGIDGYDFIGRNNNVLPIIHTLSHELSVKTNNSLVKKTLTYEYRLEYMYQYCVSVLRNGIKIYKRSKLDDRVLKCIDALYDNSMNLWKRHFDNSDRFLLHCDLHPGNIIREKISEKWKAIDPIVTTAPIEFDYVRFIENMTFSSIITEDRTDNGRLNNEKILHGFIDKALIYVNSTYERFVASLLIDSLLRLMETVIDNEGTTRFNEEVGNSLEYCCRIKEIIG